MYLVKIRKHNDIRCTQHPYTSKRICRLISLCVRSEPSPPWGFKYVRVVTMAVAKNKAWLKGQSCTSNPSKHKFRGTATGQLGLAAGIRCVPAIFFGRFLIHAWYILVDMGVATVWSDVRKCRLKS